MKTKTSSISTPVTELKYSPTGISDGVHGELYAAPAYGDLANGRTARSSRCRQDT